MKKIEHMTSATGWSPISLSALAMVLAVAVLPSDAWAAVNCTTAGTTDTDGDGFTDAQECAVNITLPNGTTFPGKASGVARENRLDPDFKDLFVVYVPASSGSFLTGSLPTAIANPFVPITAYGLVFNSFTALGVTVHKLDGTQIDPLGSRLVTSTQKAVVVFEDLDPTDIVLGYCQYGTPNRADGGVCTVYTQRIWDYINSTCAGLPIVTAGGAASNATEVFKAYTLQTILHEVGHSVGGLTSKYVSNYGGYHYAPNTTIMEQYVVAKAEDTCKFYVHKDWKTRDDTNAIKLK